ncbi:MAG: hypothetical protein EPO35_03590 [Acidobacteria bacterium]|nr:MAG: hypothetical protein EPO35_03590 [Acidobacteriota bacterium]
MKRMAGLGILAATLILLGSQAAVSAWGMDVHRLITRRAIEGLPADVKPFFMARADFIVEHSVDPDLWRVPDLSGKLGNEGPNHFLDYDGFKDPFPFKNVPREWDAVVQKYGAALANRNGRLPWRTEEIFNRMVDMFGNMVRQTPSYAGDNVRYLAAVLAHYVEDAHVPFHAVESYDGQATNQRGIHSRFETDLVLRNQTKIKLAPVVIKPIPDIRTFIFDTLIDDQQHVPPVLAADKKAAEGREFYDDAYFADFAKNGAFGVAEQRYNDAASAVASVWVAAWTKAGKPKLADPARTPARIRK